MCLLRPATIKDAMEPERIERLRATTETAVIFVLVGAVGAFIAHRLSQGPTPATPTCTCACAPCICPPPAR